MNKKKTAMLTLGVTALLAAAIPFGVSAEETSSTSVVDAGKQFYKKIVDFKGHGSTVAITKADRGGVAKEVLDLLGMDEAAVATELKAGKSLLEIAEAKGITKDALLKAQVDSMTAEISKKAEAIISSKGGEVFEGPNVRIDKGLFHVQMDNKELLELLGIDAATLKKELGSGKSLLEIAEAKGITKEALLNAQVSAMTKPLDEAVKAGKLSQEEADKMKADMTKRAEEIIANKGNLNAVKAIGGKADVMFRIDNQAILDLLGMDKETFMKELKSGKTLLQIAESKGVTKEQIIEVETKQFTAQLDEAVKAGKITQEQADKMKADFTANAATRIEGHGFGISVGPNVRFEGKPGMGRGEVHKEFRTSTKPAQPAQPDANKQS